MEESTISLVIVAVVICLTAYLGYRIDVVAKRAGWLEDDK
ncbi:hypothetical protein 0105phi72_047 [Bacillus phage 0105phi7-2]|uniref:Uncharacterized protein n=1 Tax=Bacillus phage 0105phi7-2 TaxID=3025408 RepID=A0AAE9YCY2_9CAUD|nr:hypothetical protein P9653_gp46 [Bacillus phage 0105phi7-2]WCS66592.1 hypothetical protein 0105phi72_047 [Bacillus phage 0105phi7-2]